MSNNLDRIVTIIGGIGAACAIPASAPVAGPVAIAATALPALAAFLSGKTLMDAVREDRRDDCAAHIQSGIRAAQADLDAEDAYSRIAIANRARMEQAVADILAKITKDKPALRALVVREDLDGTKIAAALFAQVPAHDPDGVFEDADAAAFFHNVVGTVWHSLRNRTGFHATLRQHIDERILTRFDDIERKLDRALAETKQMGRELGLKDGLLIGVSRRYLEDDPEDFDAALRGIEAALQAAADMRALDALPSNLGAAIDAVLARIQALNDEGRVDEATDALEAELAAADAAKARLLDRAVTQARLTNTPERAATHLLARLALDAPEQPFEALHALWNDWYERGRDRGIAFDLEVAIALARESHHIARNPDERGTALNDLGNALQTLGQRETGTGKLERAVEAYADALLERTRDRVPLDWAKTQSNLGNALRTLGQRETGTGKLEQAVTALTNALIELAHDRVPLQWATTQNNLGNALRTLGERETGTEWLEQAVTSYTDALLKYDRDSTPLQWAATQNNLGNALQTLGQRETGTERLKQAVTAYHNALTERTRDRVPYAWAHTQENMAILYKTIAERSGGVNDATKSVAHAQAALEVYREMGADYDIGTAEPLLTQCQTILAHLRDGG